MNHGSTCPRAGSQAGGFLSTAGRVTRLLVVPLGGIFPIVTGGAPSPWRNIYWAHDGIEMIDTVVVTAIFEMMGAESLGQIESLAREARLRLQETPEDCDACDCEAVPLPVAS